ncbi:MAG: TolC family protein, partial [Kiritimatiellae bacterium]|nr:TolC family protein [Kiritimatiellia bacterium]
GLSTPGSPPETGLPSDLIRRRPDVQAAWLRLQAANRDTAAAVSAQFPRLSLSGGLNSSDEGAEELFSDWAWSFAANLAAPLYNAGRLEAEADRRRAIESQRLYEYGQSVLVAFREVEDALELEQEQHLRTLEIEEQLDLAEQTLERLRISFQNGATDFLDVLTARTVLQQLQREWILTRRDRLEARIALHRALAGGFEWNGEEYE